MVEHPLAPGTRMFVDPHDGGVGYQVVIGRGFEPLTAALFERELAPGMVVVDLGANVGFYTLLAAARVGAEGQVLAFEPAPENVALLARSLEANGFEQVTLVAKACAEENGRARLFLSRTAKGLHTIGAAGAGWDAIEVETLRLDDFLGDSAAEVDLLKIDIEGAELRALAGMPQLLASARRLRILTELNPGALAASGASAEAYLRPLLSYGFTIRAAVDEAAGTVTHPSPEEVLEWCARRPSEVKGWSCNLLLARV
jgi:FkbM family methyltransferase